MNFLGNILYQFYAWAKVIFLKERRLTANYNLKLLKTYLLQIAPSMTALWKFHVLKHVFSQWDHRNIFSHGRWDWSSGSLGRLIRQTACMSISLRGSWSFSFSRNSHSEHKHEGWESKRREKQWLILPTWEETGNPRRSFFDSFQGCLCIAATLQVDLHCAPNYLISVPFLP